MLPTLEAQRRSGKTKTNSVKFPVLGGKKAFNSIVSLTLEGLVLQALKLKVRIKKSGIRMFFMSYT